MDKHKILKINPNLEKGGWHQAIQVLLSPLHKHTPSHMHNEQYTHTKRYSGFWKGIQSPEEIAKYSEIRNYLFPLYLFANSIYLISTFISRNIFTFIISAPITLVIAYLFLLWLFLLYFLSCSRLEAIKRISLSRGRY